MMKSLLMALALVFCAQTAWGDGHVYLNPKFYRLFVENRECDPQKAAAYARLLAEHEQDLAMCDTLAKIHEFLAGYYASKEFDYDRAIGHQQAVVATYSQLGDRKALAKAESALAKLYISINDIGEGLDLIYRSLDESMELNCPENIVQCNILLGNTHYKIGDLGGAYEYYTQAARLADSIKDRRQEIMALNNMGVIKLLQDNSDIGIALCRSNLKAAIENGYDDLIFPIYSNIATIYMNRDLDSALYYIRLSESYARDIQNKALYLSNMGLFYQMKGDSHRALESYNKAVGYYRQGDFKGYLSETYRNIYTESLKLKDTTQAFLALQNHYETESSTSKRDILIKLYKAKNQANEQKIKSRSELKLAKKNMLLLGCVFLFAMILAVGYILYSRRKHRVKEELIKYQLDMLNQSRIQKELKLKQEQTEYALRTKEDILKIKKLEEYQTNRLIDSIIEKLEKQNNSPEEDLEKRKKNLKQVIEDLKENKHSSNWEDVEKFLIKMNSRFYDNLTSELPKLTINEKRLCIFLHMNMTSKEIANITHQNVNSIEMARFRLRKKLDIKDSSESIHSFLQKYN